MTILPAALHVHTEFSVRDSLIRVKDLPKMAADFGWGACAITDHGAIEGVPAFLKECKKVGIKPIAGCEIYCAVPETYHFGEKFHKGDKLHHLTILAKNARGFGSILKLLSLGNRDYYDTRRQKAAIPLPMVLENLHDCIVLSGCYGSPFWRNTDKAIEDLGIFAGHFKEDFYFEVQPLSDWPVQAELNGKILVLSDALGIEAVVTPDCHFGKPDEKTFHDALLAVADRKSKFDPTVWKFSTSRSFLGTPGMVFDDLAITGFSQARARRALEMTAVVAEKISEWTWDDLPAPRLPYVEGDMKVLARHGFEALGFTGRPEYEERFKKEIEVFTQAGLGPYFLLVLKCIDVFRAEGAEIGPRGSVGGSLVAHALGISPLDPIVHGLPYERFYQPGRVGWPDIDLDFDKETRERAPEILRREFGEDRVAQISNFITFKLRMAIHDAARAYGIDLEDKSRFEDDRAILKDKEDEEEEADIEDIPPGKELARKSADAAVFARMLVGRMRQLGAHAGGFVIAADSLIGGRAAIVHRGKDTALPWNMKTADELGFVKLDFLGVDTISAIKSVGEAIRVEKSDFDWTKVPLDDHEVIKDFRDGLTAGVPQFLSAGLRSFIRNLKPKRFSDLVWASAAFRPGALGQYSPEEMAKRYNDDPGSIIVYQEEVMRLCVDLAGFSWTDADKVRKVMAKSKGEAELEKWRPRFVEGCQKTVGWAERDASEFFGMLLGFGRYAFCMAHATSYTWNSYRVAWAKRKFPLVTFAAMLNSEKNSDPILDEAPKFGVKILPPDPNSSMSDTWVIEKDGIRMPLVKVPGIDLRIAKLIIGKRSANGYPTEDDLRIRLSGYKYSEAIIPALFSGKLPGYHFRRELFTPTGKYPRKELDDLASRERMCSQCPLGKTSKKIVSIEYGKTNIMIVGESPGKEEIRRGRPLVGPSGKFLDGALDHAGLSGKDFTYTNVCHCLPPFISGENKEAIKKTEVDDLVMKCPWIEEEMAKMEPPLVLAIGKKAWNRLGGQGTIMKANATVEEINGTKVVACLHPAFVLRDRSRTPDFDRAVEKFADLVKNLVPKDQLTPSDIRRLEPELPTYLRARQMMRE